MITGSPARVLRRPARVLRAASLVAVALASLAILFPVSAWAQSPGSPFTPVPQAPATTPSTPATTPQTATVPLNSTPGTGSAGLSTGVAILIVIGAIVLIGGISFYIWHDARRHAPRHRTAAAAAGVGGRSGSKPRPKPRKLSAAERRRRKRGRAR